jgi:hypothetical protein
MGTGRRLGQQLADWLATGTAGLDNGLALGNRLCDLLGADQTLAGPLRDLARRPLLRQALQTQGMARRSALRALVSDLESTYAPRVLAELVDLLEAALGESGLRDAGPGQGETRDAAPQPTALRTSPGSAPQARAASVGGETPPSPPPSWTPFGPAGTGPSAAVPPGAATAPRPASGSVAGAPPLATPEEERAGLATAAASTPAIDRSAVARQRRIQRSAVRRLRGLGRQLRPLGPGLALAAAMALVLSWLAGVLDQLVFEPWRWSGGQALVLLVVLPQLLTIGPFAKARQASGLAQEQSGEIGQAWRWLTAPWIHDRNAEAILHALVLLLILGPSPLPLEDGVLRYALTALATMALACLSAGTLGLRGQRWAGASGVSGALIGLAACQSLLRWREISFPLGDQAVPAWVLLVVVGCLQLVWILPRRGSETAARGRHRLLCSQWFWGVALGVAWGCLSWLVSLLPSGGGAAG